MPLIRVEMFEGRTDEQKRALVQELTQACVRALGASPASVDIMLVDMPKRHWARGGVLWSEMPADPPAG